MCNPSTGKAEAGGSGVQGQPELHSEALFPKQKKRKKKGREGEIIREEGREERGTLFIS
jgi:hypothetical protein